MAKVVTQIQRKTSGSSSTLAVSEQQEIAQIAYQLYVDRGYQHGHDQEDWLRAERIVRSRRKN